MKLGRFLEFFIVGVVFGVVEDVIAILLATDAKFEPRILAIAFFVAFPFAVVSELVVDHDKFKDFIKRRFGRKDKLLG